MAIFTITKDLYDQVIDIIATSTPCTISNEDVPDYTALTSRAFAHRNIDVVTLSRYLTLMENEYQNDFDGETVESNFDQEMSDGYATCKKFLKEKSEEAAHYPDGVKGLIFSIEDWDTLDLTYCYLFRAYEELRIDRADIGASVVGALDSQAILNTHYETMLDDERKGRTEARDIAEQMLIILILAIAESSEIDYEIGDDGVDEDSPLRCVCIQFDSLNDRDKSRPTFEMHASDRLKGIRKAVYLLRDSIPTTVTSNA